MKILYAIQGTGNGHITVAREVVPILMKKAEVDILVSGCQVDIGLPFEIRYRFDGLSFIFGKKGGIDYLETFRKSNIRQLFRDIQQLDVEQYDLIFSDFEPVSAWACYLKNKLCIGFSHQAAVVNKHSPTPAKEDPLGKSVLKYYAPASIKFGFHYLPYDNNIFTPVIWKEIREKKPENNGHYTVYLPAYSNKKLTKLLSCFPQIQWHVFSKHSHETSQDENIFFRPIQQEEFVHSMSTSEGVLCNAGFQTPAEAIFLKKKLMVVPMKGQYEQQCNGMALKMLGVPVLKNLKQKQQKHIKDWLGSNNRIDLEFPDETEYILEEIIQLAERKKSHEFMPRAASGGFSRFRNHLLKKIFYQIGS